MQRRQCYQKTNVLQTICYFVIWFCNGCSIAPLTNYANNPIFQRLPTESEYFSIDDEIININMRSLKEYMDHLRSDNKVSNIDHSNAKKHLDPIVSTKHTQKNKNIW